MKNDDPDSGQMCSNYVRIIIVAFIFTLLIPSAMAGVIQITSDSYNNRDPSIDNDKIVWIREINGKGQVILYDIKSQTETQITINSNDHNRALISGNTIVYTDDGGKQFHYSLYLYDIPTKTVTAIPDSQDISSNIYDLEFVGQKIYWSSFMYDIPTKTKTTIFGPPRDRLCIMAKSGDYGVYGCYKDKNIGKTEFFLLNLKTNEKVPINVDSNAEAGLRLSGQKFSGHRFAWTDFRNGILSYDPYDPSPETSGNFGFKIKNADVYTFDLETKKETQITTDPGNQLLFGISGDKIWYVDDPIGKAELVLHDIPTNQEIRISIDDDLGLYHRMSMGDVISGDKLVYVRTDDMRKGKIFLYSPSISGTISSMKDGSKTGSSSAVSSGQTKGGTSVTKTPMSQYVIILAIVIAGLYLKERDLN